MKTELLKILPMISTSFIVLSAILVAIGWRLVVRGNQAAHQKVMKFAALCAILFFIIYVSRTIFVGNTSFGGPEELKLPYYIFLISHVFLSVVAAVMGIMTLIWGFKGQYGKHKKIGPWTAVIWFVTAITGVAVFWLLYVKYPGGTTKSVFEILTGG